MNPWYLAALIAGALGVASLAKNAAQAALPRVTGYGLVYVPTAGVNNLFDLWVTSLSGKSGAAMLAMIPGGQHVYIPMALVAKQPLNADWTYTFTPRGSSQPFTIIVPAAILQGYAAAPKSQALARATQSHAAMAAQLAHIQMLAAQPSTASTPSACSQINIPSLRSQVQNAVNSFPKSGSSTASYIGWGVSYGMKVYNDVQTVISCIQSGQLQDPNNDLAFFLDIVTQLLSMVQQATSSATSITVSPCSGTCADGSAPDGNCQCADGSTPS